MRYRPELDGVRALAVVAVMLFHTGHTGISGTGGGWMGVDIFFVLSGYLITTLLVREHDRFGSISLKRFYTRRALRLYPALLALLVLGLPFARVLSTHGTLGSYGVNSLVAGTYLSDFAVGADLDTMGSFVHTWSLAVEEQFYLVWPLSLVLLLRAGRSRRQVLGWTAAVAAVSWLSMTVFSFLPNGHNPAYFLPTSRFWELLLGCCLALVRPALSARAATAVGAATCAAMLVVVVSGNFLEGQRNQWWQSTAIALLAVTLVWSLESATGWLRGVFGWAPLAFLGRRSYGMYLYHFPLLTLTLAFAPGGRVFQSVVMVVGTIVVSVASYRFLERPFLRLKARFSSGATATPAVAVGELAS